MALELVAPFGERAALATARDIWKGRNEFQDVSQENLQGAENAPDDIVAGFDPRDASAEVWSGEDTRMKEMLLACLRENGIGSVVDDTDGKSRIRVLPSSAARAREIIREVVEASPPE